VKLIETCFPPGATTPEEPVPDSKGSSWASIKELGQASVSAGVNTWKHVPGELAERAGGRRSRPMRIRSAHKVQLYVLTILAVPLSHAIFKGDRGGVVRWLGA